LHGIRVSHRVLEGYSGTLGYINESADAVVQTRIPCVNVVMCMALGVCVRLCAKSMRVCAFALVFANACVRVLCACACVRARVPL
jgi:hypothetical protein